MVGRNNCCVPQCSSSTTGRHRFPNPSSEINRFKIWMKAINNVELMEKDPAFVYRNKRVCTLHFENKYIGPNKLFCNAVPTLNIPGSSSIEADVIGVSSTAEGALNLAPEVSGASSVEADAIGVSSTAEGALNLTPEVSGASSVEADAIGVSSTAEGALNLTPEVSGASSVEADAIGVSSTAEGALNLTPEVSGASSVEAYAIGVSSTAEGALNLTPEFSGASSINHANMDDIPSTSGLASNLFSTKRTSNSKLEHSGSPPRTALRILREAGVDRACITPRKKKLYNALKALRKTYTVEKNRVKSFRKRLFEAKKFQQNYGIESLQALNSMAFMLINCQLREFRKTKNLRRFTLNEKLLALVLYKQGAKSYSLLSKIFILPSKSTLDRLLTNIVGGPGINDRHGRVAVLLR